MATVTPTRASAPALPLPSGVSVETVAIADGDDLDLGRSPGEAARTIKTTPGAATTSLASISDGDFPGQRVTLVVVNANTLRVPAALVNVNLGANLDVVRDVPKTLVWDGADWFVAAA